MTSHLVSGLAALGSVSTVILILFGTAIGMFVGILPGLGVILVLTLMLPFIRHMGILQAVGLMLATQSGVYFAASITAILLNTPGAPESFPTTFDGFPMAKRGEAGKALAISATSTWMGGWVACIFFVGLIQLALPMARVFHPPEFVMIIAMAIVLIAQTGNIPLTKVLISALFGLMLSFVGSDPVTGVERFTLGLPTLYSGIEVVPFALGVFAVTQMVKMYGSKVAVSSFDRSQFDEGFHRQVRMGIVETFRNWYHVVRSAIIAILLGLVPGIGSFAANFISYSLGKRVSKNGDKFGTGVTQGLISAEGSSLAKEVASLIPAVALGLPSGLGMVIFLAALTILGLEPGFALLKTYPSLPYSMMWVVAIAGLLSCALGLLLAPQLSKITVVKGPLLFPFIVTLAILGSFANANTLMGIYLLIVFSILGVIVRELEYSVASMAIGLVLGGIFDDNIHLTSKLYGWDFLYKSPLADVFLLVTIYLLVSAGLLSRRNKAKGAKGGSKHPLLEWTFDLFMVIFSTAYFVVGLGYPPQAGQIPVVVSLLVMVVSTYRLVFDVRVWMQMRGDHSNQLPPQRDTSAEISKATAVNLPEMGSLVGLIQMEEDVQPIRNIDQRKQNLREVIALLWFVAFFGVPYLIGFKIGVPLITLIYALVNKDIENFRKRIGFALTAAAATGIVAFAFFQLFHLSFSGIL